MMSIDDEMINEQYMPTKMQTSILKLRTCHIEYIFP